jgi:erythromycin esterase
MSFADRVLRWSIAFAAVVVLACNERVTTEPETLLPDNEQTRWTALNAQILKGTTPNDDDSDLNGFLSMVGTADIIGAGEATHGTREFFDIKHRFVRALARRAELRAVAIEASLPDALELDAYVRTGVGDPTRALSRLFFWTSRTQEMLDLVNWLRQFNAGRPTDRRIGFYGIDMQYPGTALRRLIAWMPRAMPGSSQRIADSYACLEPYVNDARGQFTQSLGAQPPTKRTECRTAARAAYDSLLARAGELTARVGRDTFDLHLALARTLVQWTTREAGAGTLYRDQAMAENVRWLAQHVGGRILVSGHNAHVGSTEFAMGRWLRDSVGARYVSVGFAFDSGSFTARPGGGGEPTALRIGGAPKDTYEEFFRPFGKPLYIDLRAQMSYNVRTFFTGPFAMREIGALFLEQSPNLFLRPTSPVYEYDLMLFVPVSTPSRVLPFTP